MIAKLVGLRYQLLWAGIRTRNGRIALFGIGFLCFAMLSSALGKGGFSAGVAAVREGQGEAIARAVFSLLFLQAVIVSSISGFGMNSIFSDVELRRYPLTSIDRQLSRNVIAILDPFWFIFLALYLSLACGLAMWSSIHLAIALFAAILLFLCNYVVARVVALAVDHMSATGAGAELLLALALLLIVGTTVAVPAMHASPAWMSGVLPWLQYTPPFSAASAVFQTAGGGVLALSLWLFGFTAILAWIEPRPVRVSKRKAGGVAWDNMYDRAAGLFNPQLRPLVGVWLRIFARNNFVRRSYILVFPLVGYLTYRNRNDEPNGLLISALGMFPFGLCLIGWRLTVNLFGYLDGGFRRCLLLPAASADILRTGSYASLVIKAPALLIGLVAWILFAPVPFDVRILVMLLCSSVAGSLVFHALGIWISLFNPRRGNYAMRIGNDSSLGANLLVIITGLVCAALPRIIDSTYPGILATDSWWILVPLPPIAAVFYFVTITVASRAFAARRGRLLGMAEGKN